MDAIWTSDLAPMIFVTAFAVAGTLLYPLMQGLRHRLEGRGARDVDTLRADVQALRAEVEALRDGQIDHGAQARLAELEERVDFAERLLARGSQDQAERA